MRVAVVASYGPSLTNFRGDLISSLVKAGHEVYGLAPEPGLEVSLSGLGARYIRVPLDRTSISVKADLTYLYSLLKVFSEVRPELVLSYTAKPVIYASIAARLAGVKAIYSIITGLGYSFTGHGLRQRLIRGLLCFLYRKSLRLNTAVFFQNPDDLKVFRDYGLLSSSARTAIMNGSGVNLERFPAASPRLGPPVFLLIARLLRDKGIFDFVEAARLLKPRYPEVKFRLLGPFDSNPSAISAETVHSWTESGVIEYLGETDDVRPYLADASVYVLPSYREGTPRSVLEAMAMGKPVVTTDVPGCRETVVNGDNGWLVPVKDARSLACALERFILEPESIVRMGHRSRQIAEEKYDVHKVNAAMLQTMEI